MRTRNSEPELVGKERLEAQEPRSGRYSQRTPLDVIGTRVPRVDALAKVTGRATYTCDVRLPNMLYAVVLRSPHPSAKVLAIDAVAAGKLTGVPP